MATAGIERAARRRVEARGSRSRIAKGWHVNANPPALDYLIPTEAKVERDPGVTPGAVHYPAAKKVKLGFEDSELAVYDGETVLEIPVAAAATAPDRRADTLGRDPLPGVQRSGVSGPGRRGVHDSRPRRRRRGGRAGIPASEWRADRGRRARGGRRAAPARRRHRIGHARHERRDRPDSRLEGALARGGLVWFLSLFVGGLLLNLTPCVFPMLGVTVSIFGARRQEPCPR